MNETATGDPLDIIIADYIQAVEAGRVPSREDLLAAHSEYASDLHAFFADFDRMDNRAEAFRLNAKPPAVRPTVKYFGNYELLEEIAEGGMGLVYKARQLELGRIVALKLIRAGSFAKPIDVARFRIEAEAAAALDHPNIVPLYEVGEHEGQQFLAMKYIDGPPLARYARADIRTEVSIMEQLCRAVHHAHQQGILHRDIKPGNILVTGVGGRVSGAEHGGSENDGSASGISEARTTIGSRSGQSRRASSSRHPTPDPRHPIPYITDFGLAKRIDVERSLTETGAQLGTAGYMSPEQAMGKKGLTFASDVFSLGAILYERFTGKMAFPGATLLERIRALDNAPSRPTTLMPTLHRDLETVCLKCLEREPHKRYQSAGDLADDLARWQRGEPIVARPVTTMERFWLWCRRNPAIAGWAGVAVAAIIVGGTTTSIMTVKAKRALTEANQYLDQAKSAMTKFVHTLIQTLGVRINDERSPTERWATFEIAQQNDEFKATLLAEFLSSPEFAEKFAKSSDYAVQAAVGASDKRRQVALNIARAKLHDPEAKEQIRYAAMILALQLGADDFEIPEWTGDSWLAAKSNCPWTIEVSQLTLAQMKLLTPHWLNMIQRTENADVISWAAKGLERRCDAGEEAAAIAIRASDSFVAILTKTSNPEVMYSTRVGLTAMARHLDQAAAIRTFDDLIAIVEKTKEYHALRAAGMSLSALAERMDQPAAIRAFDDLIAGLRKATYHAELHVTEQSLVALAARFDQRAAIGASGGLIVALEETRNLSSVKGAVEGVYALAAHLDAPTAIRASNALVSGMEKTTDLYALQTAGQALAALAPRLDPTAASRAFNGLVGVLEKTPDSGVLDAASKGFTALARRLDPPAADRAFAGLLAVLERTPDHHALHSAGQGLAALAPRFDQPSASRAFDDLIAVLGKTSKEEALRAAGQGLSILPARLDQPAAIRAFNGVADALERITNPNALQAAARGLIALPARLDQSAAIRASDRLVAVLGRTTDQYALQAAGQGLRALAAQLDQSAANRAFDGLLTVVESATGDEAVQAAGQGLVALAVRLDQSCLIRAIDRLAPILGKTANYQALNAACQGLAALAARLDQPAAYRICDGLIAVLEATTHPYSSRAASEALSALAPRLDQPAAIRASDGLVAALRKESDSYALYMMEQALAALAARLDQPAAIRASDGLIAILGRSTDQTVLQANGQALAALATRLDTPTLERGTRSFIANFHRLDDDRGFDASRAVLHELVHLLPEQARPELRQLAGRAVVDCLRKMQINLIVPSSWDSIDFLADEFSFDVIESIPVGSVEMARDTSLTFTGSFDLHTGAYRLGNEIDVVAKWLKHPACVGQIRQQVLHRVEELAFPPGDSAKQAAVVESAAIGMTDPSAAGLVAVGRQTQWEKQRKFRTTWEAVDWLKKNHPEINLDAPYRPQR